MVEKFLIVRELYERTTFLNLNLIYAKIIVRNKYCLKKVWRFRAIS